MKPLLEPAKPVPPDASFFLYRRDDPEFEFNWHYHPEIELTYIVAGKGNRTVGNRLDRFRPGDLVLIGPNLPHVWVSDPEDYGQAHQAIVVQCREEVLAPGLGLVECRRVAGLLASGPTIGTTGPSSGTIP
jgi:hypothetical protein